MAYQTAPQKNVRKAMTEGEARKCCEAIRGRLRDMAGHVEEVRRLAYELHERDGWRALGYQTWTACVRQEFEDSEATVYKQLKNALVEVDTYSRTDSFGRLSDRQCSELAKAPEGQRAAVLDAAAERAGKASPSAKDIRAAVLDAEEATESQRELRQVRKDQEEIARADKVVSSDERKAAVNKAEDLGEKAIGSIRRGWQFARRCKRQIRIAYGVRCKRAIAYISKAMHELELLMDDEQVTAGVP